jgi:DnaJ-class molecular chaperone
MQPASVLYLICTSEGGCAMKRIESEVIEEICPACNGTGIQPVKQPAPGRRIYPPKCAKCGGKGRVKEAAN